MHHVQPAVGVQRQRVDALLDEELGELGVVAGRLPADAHGSAGGVSLLDQLADEPLDRGSALVEQLRQPRIVPADAERQLRVSSSDSKMAPPSTTAR